MKKMSGQYSGVQSRIAAENSTAVYVHSHGHVLNLVLVDTCSRSPIAKIFLGLLRPYVFFQASTKKHALLVQALGELHLERTVTLKHLSDTRWACRVDNLKALNKSLLAIIKSLDKIIDGETDGKTTCEAVRLHSVICSFQFVFTLLYFWTCYCIRRPCQTIYSMMTWSLSCSRHGAVTNIYHLI